MKFEDLNLEPEVLQGLDAMNFKEATPVQEATIPVVLDGKDLIACAQTGTGKTAAYILPLLNLLTRRPSEKIWYGLSLSPLPESWPNRSICSSRDFPIFCPFPLLS